MTKITTKINQIEEIESEEVTNNQPDKHLSDMNGVQWK